MCTQLDSDLKPTIEEKDTNPAGLYVHVPFCRSKCLYCDFYSIPCPSLSAAWLDALEKEALLYKGRFSCFDTLYLGGGTPTLLSDKEISRLVEFLYRHFRISLNAEITLEANPNDITHKKLNLYRDLGFNRISLGVQSLDQRDLEFLGRRHTARQAVRAMERIKTAGFPTLGIDLIYGLPGQTITEWKKTLEGILVFEPRHISCYQLTLSRGTPLWNMQEQGRIEPLNEETERSLFLTASEFLEDQGFVHYEVSNYAGCVEERNSPGNPHQKDIEQHPGETLHVCRHNLKYWERTPYLGLGPSAHSFQGNARWWNHRSIKLYCEDLEQGRWPVRGSERLSREQASLEKLSLQMRTKAGTQLQELRGYEKTEAVLPGLLAHGYLEVIDERAVPTREGFLLADRLPLLFL